jgi:hypothetical protein
MKILLDRAGLQRLVLLASAQYQDKRYYYVAKDARAIVVARNGLQLGVSSANQVADCVTGMDAGTPGFVFERNEGKTHSKMTIFRYVRGRYDSTLSEFLNAAPKE